MLWDKAFNQAPSNVATFRTVEAGSLQRYKELYPDRTVPFPIKVDINEYAATSEIAVGGSLIHYIARYDELKNEQHAAVLEHGQLLRVAARRAERA
ncbi:hypothetical protein ACFTAO_16325 [Paenibacillus rhizoplanae]